MLCTGNQVEREEIHRNGRWYKIIHLGRNSLRNGVEVIVDEEIKSKIVDEIRKRDRIIVV